MTNGKDLNNVLGWIENMAWDDDKEDYDFCKLNEIYQFFDVIEEFLIQHYDDKILGFGYRTFIDALEWHMDFEFRTSFTEFEELKEYANDISERLGKTIYVILYPKETNYKNNPWIREYEIYLLNKETLEWESHYCAVSHTETDALERIDGVIEVDAW